MRRRVHSFGDEVDVELVVRVEGVEVVLLLVDEVHFDDALVVSANHALVFLVRQIPEVDVSGSASREEQLFPVLEDDVRN